MRARRTTSPRFSARFAVIPLLVVSFLMYAAVPAFAVPSLQGAFTQQVSWFDQGEGPASPPGCDPTATSTVPFSGTSNLFGGSYGSLITINGSVTVGPQNQPVDLNNDPGYGFPANYGTVTGASGSFSMSTP